YADSRTSPIYPAARAINWLVPGCLALFVSEPHRRDRSFGAATNNNSTSPLPVRAKCFGSVIYILFEH
ncbi:hypothetical protein ABK046_51405, partial [Streptomyces caeruleatus]